MSLRDKLCGTSLWTWISLTGLATLTIVDFWRDLGPTDWPILRGSLPNFVAVPTLVFGFLSLRYRESLVDDSARTQRERRDFWLLWTSMLTVVIVWEFLQRSGGNLIFDPLDLYATIAGALVAVMLFLGLRKDG